MMAPKRTRKADPVEPSVLIPGHAQIIAEIGTRTAEAIRSLVLTVSSSDLFAPPEDLFPALNDALKHSNGKGPWKDAEAALVIKAVRDRFLEHREIDLTSLSRWIRIHPNDPEAIMDCLRLDPPEKISIIQLLSRAGSQKLVFLANWEIAQREVVLKSFIGDSENLIHRELQPHPLSMAHRNIIETHFVRNKQGEIFLVERRLPTVLSDAWRSQGIQEATNLLRDIGNALAFLEDKQLVHGDIKPDNIGFEDGNYILLDFGICRPSETFIEDVSPTGSLRTRAPEVLLREKPHSHLSDVWALGATVYNCVTGRFPLFDFSERPPRLSEESERNAFESELERRVVAEWSERVDLSLVPDPLREVVARSLERNPESRISAVDLCEVAEREFAAFLRVNEGENRFSPKEELEQLNRYLPGATVLALMPYNEKQDLRRRLELLRSAKGITAEQINQIDDLTRLVA